MLFRTWDQRSLHILMPIAKEAVFIVRLLPPNHYPEKDYNRFKVGFIKKMHSFSVAFKREQLETDNMQSHQYKE